MADSSGKKGPDTHEQHPYVEKLRPDPSQPPRPVVTLTGLLGRSDRPGYQRLYFTRDLGTFAEFLSSDILFVEAVPAAESPINGIDASRVSLPQDASVHYTRSTKATAVDEFDLNLRTAQDARALLPPIPPPTAPIICGTDTLRTDCGQATCDTCQTKCGQNTCNTCNTCQTQCGQNTCNTCNTCQTQCGQNTCNTCNTCQTQCGQNTCNTCRTQCGQNTCNTCRTQCGQNTCNTCRTQCDQATCDCQTLNRHAFTCGPNRQCL